MRNLILGVAAAACGLLVVAPAPGRAESTCDASGMCGVPVCRTPELRTRAATTRSVLVVCRRAESAKLVSPPDNAEVLDWWIDWYGLHVTLRTTANAAPSGDAVFELSNGDGTVQQHLPVLVTPISENHAPVCEGDRQTRRSDGASRTWVVFEVDCHDPDGDPFTIYGGGPGTATRAPEEVPEGPGERWWSYEPATVAGTETTRIWAVDSFGARSADATLTATVGPSANDPPQCSEGGGTWDGVYYVVMRQGKPRRFGFSCIDYDSDPVTATIAATPARGTLSLSGYSPLPWYPPADGSYAMTYVPADDSLTPEAFSMQATDGRVTRRFDLEMTPRPPSVDGGADCTWDPPVHAAPAQPAQAWIWCSDDEGDPLSARIVSGPSHGTATVLSSSQDAAGANPVRFTYTAAPGYQGSDSLTLELTDAYGLRLELPVAIAVAPWPGTGGPPLPPVQPSAGAIAPIAPAGVAKSSRRATAARVLGSHSVRRLIKRSQFEVWGLSRLSRRALLRDGRARAMVVFCTTRCNITSDARFIGKGLRQARSRTVAAGTKDPRVISLSLSRRARNSMRLRQGVRALIDLRVRSAAGGTARLKQLVSFTGR